MIFAIIMAFVVAILLNGFRQDEQVMAVAAARAAGVECATEKGLILGPLEDVIDDATSTFTIIAKFYDQNGDPVVSASRADDCKTRMKTAISKTLGEQLGDVGGCPKGGQYHYCVV
jgi:hypothetical protein